MLSQTVETYSGAGQATFALHAMAISTGFRPESRDGHGTKARMRWHTADPAGHTQICISPSEPDCTDTVKNQGGQRTGPTGCTILAHPDLVLRAYTPCISPSLANSPEEGTSLSGAGHNLAPESRPLDLIPR